MYGEVDYLRNLDEKGSWRDMKGTSYSFLRNFFFILWAYRETRDILKVTLLTLSFEILRIECQKKNGHRDCKAKKLAEKLLS